MTDTEKQEELPLTENNTESTSDAGASEHLLLEIEELREKLLRTAAEYENSKRRHDKQLEDSKVYSITNFAKDLMSVMDNLSRALDHVPVDCDAMTKNFITGVEMTKSELTNIFSKHGIDTILPLVGEKFDYNIHHAIMQVPTEEHPQGTILQIMQVGYKINDRLLRPATVAVTKAL